ncbi:MAG TPA: MFS transporter [Hyphomicrobium sp.]|nr:MFS transporter [Hyphomicrobium sp.]HRO50141.1 MFS transporter [Hyphomicrobium sp.]
MSRSLEGPSSHEAAAADYRLRLSAFYGALFLILGIHLPFLPVWLDARGLTAQEIAIVTAAPLVLRVFVTPTTAVFADRTGRHRSLVNILALVALLLALLLSQMHGFWGLLLFAVPFAISLSTIMPLTETLAVSGVRAYGLDYGRMRLWGSISFVGAGFLCGWLIDTTNADAVIACLLAGVVTTVACAWALPERASAGASNATGDSAAKSQASHARGSFGLNEVGRLVKTPVFLGFLVAAGAVQGAHGMFYAFGALAWQAQGISTVWIGALWAVAIAGEVLLFAYSGRVVTRWAPATLLVAAGCASVVRWALMALSPALAVLVPLQLLHALTYGASHLAAMHFISRAVPEGSQGTAQALYATMAMGILIGGATLASGRLYAEIGAEAYFAMAALAAVGLAAALFVRARWTGGLLWAQK